MKIALLWIGLAAGLASPQSRMPAWLADYPGVSPQTRSSAVLVESTYDVAATPGEVIGHYRKLFEAAGLAWQPNLDGVGTVVRGAASECDLLLKIREQGTGTSVRVSCAARVPAPMLQATPAPAAPVTPPTRQSVADERRREISRKSLEEMEKYDQPYRPPPRPPAPRLVWPEWLVSVDGAPLAAERGVDQFKLNYLKSAYLTNADRNGAVAFYTELLNANGYRVMHTPPTWPRDRKAWLNADFYPGANPGPRIAIHVDFTPDEQGMRVDVRMTAHQ